MGWRERDYAKFTDEEWRILCGSAERRPDRRRATATRSRRRPRGGVAWGAAMLGGLVVLLALSAAAAFPRSHPLLSRIHGSLAGRGTQTGLPHRYPLRLPRQAQTGSRLILTGSLPQGVSGPITIRVHWNSQPWQRLGVIPVATSGAYRGLISLDRTGMLNVRLRVTNGDMLVGSIRVTR